jgi:hypothetical protein
MNLQVTVGQCFGVLIVSFPKALVVSLAIFVTNFFAFGLSFGSAGGFSFLVAQDCLFGRIGLDLG